jgi:hypothetical protein
MSGEKSIPSDSTNTVHRPIDKVLSMYSNVVVPLYTDSLETFKQKLTSNCKRVRVLRKEKARLAEAHNRYLAIQAELKGLERSTDRMTAILGDQEVDRVIDEDRSGAVADICERHESDAKRREHLPLWEAIREYLESTGEAQVNDILLFLRWYAMDSSREAVESALRTHKDVFKTVRRGRDKFVSLKGV